MNETDQRLPVEEAPYEFRRPPWQARANCHPDVIPHVWQEFGDSPVDLFFPQGPVTPARRAAIRQVCGPCPVRAECRQQGIQHEAEGFWGELGSVKLDDARRAAGIRRRTPELDPGNRLVLGTFIPPGHGTEGRYMQHVHAKEKPCEACRGAHALARREQQAEAWQVRKATETPEGRQARLKDSRVRGAAARARVRRASQGEDFDGGAGYHDREGGF